MCTYMKIISTSFCSRFDCEETMYLLYKFYKQVNIEDCESSWAKKSSDLLTWSLFKIYLYWE